MSIFLNDQERINNLNQSADKLGHKQKEKKKVKTLVAKPNCKRCHGIGAFAFLAPGRHKKEISYCRCVKEKEIEIE